MAERDQRPRAAARLSEAREPRRPPDVSRSSICRDGIRRSSNGRSSARRHDAPPVALARQPDAGASAQCREHRSAPSGAAPQQSAQRLLPIRPAHADDLEAPRAPARRARITPRSSERPGELLHARRSRSAASGTASSRARWGLSGDVREDALRSGSPTGSTRHRRAPRPPPDAAPLHQCAGERTKTMEHRAGWDATFSAPKSVSLTALVGGDERVREAHRASVAVALRRDRSDTSRPASGGNRPAETTGQWVAATFEHDSARPVDGYAAPQLHTHVGHLQSDADGRGRPGRCSRGNCTGRSSMRRPSTDRSSRRA